MLCKHCAKEIPDDSQVCPNCGAKIEQEVQKKFYKKKWFTWLMIIVFWPVGLFLLWKNNLYSKKVNIIVTAIFLVLWLIGVSLPKKEVAKPVTASASVTQTEQKNEKPVKTDSAVNVDTKKANVTTASPVVAAVDTAKTVKKEVTYIGNSSSRKFHYEFCQAAKKTKAYKKVTFKSRDAAINAGYKPCGICQP